MFIINDFIGDTTLRNDWSGALFDMDFEFIMREAEESSSETHVKNYVYQVIEFLKKTSICDVASRAEQDVLLLEEICRAFYHHTKNESDYACLAQSILTFAHFPYRDKELCTTLGVLYLSTHYRIWACKKYLQELVENANETSGIPLDLSLFVMGNWHPKMVEMQEWFQRNLTEPKLSKIYLHAFDLKMLSYYTREFNDRTAYEIMRDYIKKYDTLRLS